jgi:hypothetical protein
MLDKTDDDESVCVYLYTRILIMKDGRSLDAVLSKSKSIAPKDNFLYCFNNVFQIEI